MKRNDLERLHVMLTEDLERHRTLRACLDRKRDAIRAADVVAIERACVDAERIVRDLDGAERRRRDFVAHLTRGDAPERTTPYTLAEIAARCDDEALRDRLVGTAGVVRDAAEGARRESSIVAEAARALIRHVGGIMQQVHGALGGPSVYERRGRLAVAAQVEYSVDVTT